MSAGNTGAMLAAGLLHLRRLPGVMRPAIAVPIPARHGPERAPRRRRERRRPPRPPAPVRRTWASVFSEEILGVRDPGVRLLSIGEEDEKGNQLTLEAHQLLATTTDLNFQGNAESRDLLRGAADVVVTDGFTGNIALKLLEGTIKELLDALREEIASTATGKLGGAADPAGRAAAAHAARSRHLRRRVPARAARPGRDRARLERPHGDRERDPARRARSGAPRRRAARGAAPGTRRCMIAAVFSHPNPQTIEVTWQRRVKRSTSGSRKS